MAICLVTAFAASAMALGWEIIRWIKPGRFSNRIAECFFALLGGIGACGLATEWIDASHSIVNGPTRIASEVLGLVCLLAVVGTIAGRLLIRESLSLRKCTHSQISCVIFALIAVIAYSRLGSMVRAGFSLFPDELNVGQVQKDDGWIGETDMGNLVPLYHFNADEQQFQSFASTFQGRFPNFSNTLITRHTADKEANCHGWVFTHGRFLIRGESVETILKDNHYRMVTDPIASDVIIYRDIAGNILHTAIVQAVLEDGTVLAESKWGIDKRFIHLPEHQPYSSVFSYYRTNRKDHLILVHRADQQSIATMLDD